MKRIILAVVAVIVVFVVLGGIKAHQIVTLVNGMETMQLPPETVTSATVAMDTWQPTIPAIGSIAAVQGVMVRAELTGTVSRIAFESGTEVEKGDLLVQLDVSTEEAQLRSAEADATLAKEDLERARDLSQRNVIAPSEMDSAKAKYDAATAQVENIQSLIAKKTITAPFSGRVGIRQVNLGQVLEAGAGVVTLQAVKQVYADFSVPQQNLSQLEVGMDVEVTTDAFPGRRFPGKLTALNSSIDEATRSLPLQATLDNPDGLLRPGMFAKVEIVLPEKKSVLAIPATAVAYAPYGDSVYVIEEGRNEKTGEPELTLRQQFVRLGDTRGDFVEVTKGLEGDEQVVSSGIFKLRNGMAVKIDNALAPTASLNPTPSES